MQTAEAPDFEYDEDIDNEGEPCEECGSMKKEIRQGYLYCGECGLRPQYSQPQLSVQIYQADQPGPSAFSARKINTKKKDASQQYSDMWTTWHANNLILIGLVDEVINLGAKHPRLRQIVLFLWCRWLKVNRVAFYSSNPEYVPKIPLGAKKRDLKLMMGITMPKKKVKKKPTLESLGIKPVPGTRTNKYYQRKLVKEEYDKFIASQQSTSSQNQPKPVVLEKSNFDTVDLKAFAPRARKVFKKVDPFHLTVHKRTDDCGRDCPFYRYTVNLARRESRAAELSIPNLYSIIQLALILCGDEVQLGDMLRWIREGHLTYGNYLHFFPEDMRIHRQDHLWLVPVKMSHLRFRIRTRRITTLLKIENVPRVSIEKLIERYVRDYNLPKQLVKFALKLMAKTNHVRKLQTTSIPNYEATAFAYIIVALKIIFGLNGTTEDEISASAIKINEVLGYEKVLVDPATDVESDVSSQRLFVWSDWMKFVNYRKILLTQFHYPSAFRHDPDYFDNPELFLHHRKTTSKEPEDKPIKNFIDVAMKTLLENPDDEEEPKFPTFTPTIMPMSSYTREILNFTARNRNKWNIKEEIILEKFTNYDVSYTLKPDNLKTLLNEKNLRFVIDEYRSSNIVIDEDLRNFTTERIDERTGMHSNLYAECQDCDLSEFKIKLNVEKINNLVADKVETEEVKMVTLKSFRVNKMDRIGRDHKKSVKENISLRICHPHFWQRHYEEFPTLFSGESFQKELETNYPPSFVWLMKEFASHVEFTTYDLYKEVMSVERRLMNSSKSDEVK